MGDTRFRLMAWSAKDVTLPFCLGFLLIINAYVPAAPPNPEEVTKMEGDSLVFTCNVTIRPLPIVAFYFLSIEVTQNWTSSAANTNTSLAVGRKLAASSQETIGWVELRVSAVDVNDSGRYSCIAQLPGNMYYTIAAYDVTVMELASDFSTTAASETNGQSSTATGTTKLFDLWKIGVIVIGTDAILVFILVTVIVCKIKHSGKDNETAPLNDEDDASEFPANDIMDTGEDTLTTSTQRARNLPDRYYNQDIFDDSDVSRTRRPTGRLPPLDRPSQQGFKPNILDENEKEEMSESNNSAKTNKRQRQLTSSQ